MTIPTRGIGAPGQRFGEGIARRFQAGPNVNRQSVADVDEKTAPARSDV